MVLTQSNSRSGPVDVASLIPGWSDRGTGSLARRLAHAIRNGIESGLIGDGVRLPPERSLAASLAISRSTVATALDELRSDGLVVSRQGSGTIVVGPGSRVVAGSRIAEHFGGWTGIDLAAGNPPDASHLPSVSVDVADLVATGEGPGVQPLGLMALRTAVADRLTEQGRLTDIDQVHITAGAHQAVSVAIRSLLRPGGVLATEDPSYPGIFDIADGVGARVAPVPSDSGGLIPAELERVLSEDRPAVLYMQTGPHNPLGHVTGPARLRALAEVLDRHSTPVIEDTTLADLTFGGRVGPELVDLCRAATVIGAGSLSKVVWGGLRIGWLTGPSHFIERSKYVRLGSDLGPAVPSQLLAIKLMPHLDDIAAKRRATLEKASRLAVDQIRAELPDWRVEMPAGGSVLWVEVPTHDTGPFVQLAARHGVRVAPGAIARSDRVAGPFLRICVDRTPEHVEVGLRRLGLAWHELTASPGHIAG